MTVVAPSPPSRPIRLAIIILLGTVVIGFAHWGRSVWVPLKNRLVGKKTTAEVMASLRRRRPELATMLPPQGRDLTLLVLKRERLVELWADEVRFAVYPMTAFSGTLGPKRREGDGQIPEGFYRPVFLNPNSAYHLSIKLDYPNADDRENGRREQRSSLGGNIFIHGKAVSIGCIAIGDPGIEAVFYAVGRVGMDHTRVIIAPYDMRGGRRTDLERGRVPWVIARYDRLAAALAAFRERKRVAPPEEENRIRR
ncbi:MAG: L,D-transpeptidase family protein [Victivallales bacterium]|nr:L,D-transpeptidase family protein [Victivallales bacterium]